MDLFSNYIVGFIVVEILIFCDVDVRLVIRFLCLVVEIWVFEEWGGLLVKF